MVVLEQATEMGSHLDKRLPQYIGTNFLADARYLGVVYSSQQPFHIPDDDAVPPLEEVNKAHADLRRIPDAHGVVFSQYGYVTRESFPGLRHKCELFDLADRMLLNPVAIRHGLNNFFSGKPNILKRELRPYLDIVGLVRSTKEGHVNNAATRDLFGVIQRFLGDKIFKDKILREDKITYKDRSSDLERILDGRVTKPFAERRTRHVPRLPVALHAIEYPVDPLPTCSLIQDLQASQCPCNVSTRDILDCSIPKVEGDHSYILCSFCL